MAVFGDSVSREQYEDMKEQRNQARADLLAERERYAALVGQFVDLRRHQEGMNPAKFDPASSDPMSLLGPSTQAAVEEMCSDDAELRIYLRNRAYLLGSMKKDEDPGERDERVSALIRAGDTD